MTHFGYVRVLSNIIDSADAPSSADIGQSMDVDPADGVATDTGPTSTVPEPSTAAPSGEDPPIFMYGRTFGVSDEAPTTDLQDREYLDKVRSFKTTSFGNFETHHVRDTLTQH
ncbi:hypothetical protein CTI12_AA275450 [Artemisia annua]|uniref:Uncharacterized protein n=1 Tax=Artemisia annua TaxID=35608 RepID=A0A2U1NER3_ARTAN|nr:hypothetical protein CTI12_AA275450 [Artemisia annua]